MSQSQLFEIIKAVGWEQSRIVSYVNNMTFELNQMKEKAKEEGLENELYKINSKTGTNQYFRLSFSLGETKILLNKYQQIFKQLTTAYDSGNYNIDLNDPIIVSSCKHFLDENGVNILDNNLGYSKDSEVKSSIEYQISPYTSSFGNNIKIFEFHCLDNYLDLEKYEIDVQAIYNELENNEENYTDEDLKEIKNATVQLANLFARRRNSMNFEVKDVLYDFDFSQKEMESTGKHM